MSEVPVPREFVGLARRLVDRVNAADTRVCAGLPVVVAPLAQRLARRPSLRREMVPDAARAWKALVGDEFTLAERQTLDHRTLELAALRVGRGTAHRPEWEGTAVDAVLLAWVAINAGRRPDASPWRAALGIGSGIATTTYWQVAVLPLHALARRYERGVGSDDAAVVDDLAQLGAFAIAGPSRPVLPDSEPIRAECPVIGGRWVGAWESARDDEPKTFRTHFWVNTFLNPN